MNNKVNHTGDIDAVPILPIGTPHPDPCAKCNSTLVLRWSRYGLFYGCTQYPDCNGTATAHKDGRPMSEPADDYLKGIRHLLHEIIDPMWKDREDSNDRRTLIYEFMGNAMCIQDFHIGYLNKDQAKEALVLAQRELPKYF